MRIEQASFPVDYVLTGGVLVDPASHQHGRGEIWVRHGNVEEVRFAAKCAAAADVPRIDMHGATITPGLVDVHVHFREPGQEYKEDIESGSYAAVAGGFTSVVMMPNTEPAIDCGSVVEAVLRRGREVGLLDVHCAGALTQGRRGERLAEYHDMRVAGACTLTDDGSPVSNPAVMRRALEHAAMLGFVTVAHSEEKTLSHGGHMHEGTWSTQLGITGIPAAAEEVGVARDLLLARETGAPIHIAHVSTRGAADLIRLAKQSWGVDVTAEAAPHHLALTDAELARYSADYKMNPPLRSEADRQAVIAAVADGTLDFIATDHAPHAPMEKELELDQAPVGVIGLETAFAVAHTTLVVQHGMTLIDLIARMSLRPAQRFGLTGGRLTAGEPANLAVLDPAETWTFELEHVRSRSRNTPFVGRALQGRVLATVYGGRLVSHLPAMENASAGPA